MSKFTDLIKDVTGIFDAMSQSEDLAKCVIDNNNNYLDANRFCKAHPKLLKLYENNDNCMKLYNILKLYLCIH